MNITNELKSSLKREFILCSNAVTFYKKAIKAFEQRYHLSTQSFLKRFEAGRMGDDADYFDWFAFSKLLSKWQKTQSAIRSAVR